MSVWLGVVLSAGLLAGCGEDPTDVEEDLAREEVATGITSPWGLVEVDGGDLLVAERDTGRIERLDPDSGEAVEVRTLPDVVPGGEAGLLGLALTPDEDRLLAYYTLADSSRIVSMGWDGEELGEPETIFEGIPGGAGYHQGGRLVVGPDGYVYVGTGDNGVPDNAQDTDSLSGKVLRLTLDGEPAPGNPFGNAVWSYGHRNVEGLAFDDQGRLWASEFGQQSFDELNLIEPGENYGWPQVEGRQDPPGADPDLTDPVRVWSTADASPSGLAWWDGSLWMAALRGQRLWEVPVDASGETAEPVAHLQGRYGRLRTVLALDDALLVTSSNTDGRGEVADGDDRVVRLTR